jgi:hypothetical protein
MAGHRDEQPYFAPHRLISLIMVIINLASVAPNCARQALIEEKMFWIRKQKKTGEPVRNVEIAKEVWDILIILEKQSVETIIQRLKQIFH